MPNILSNPIVKARMIARMNLPAILDRDQKKRAKTVQVPGSDGKNYQVVIHRHPKKGSYLESITTMCELMTSVGNIPCQGNSNGSICYHSFTAILFSAMENDVDASICRSYDGAKHFKRLKKNKATIIQIKGSKKYYYIVAGGTNAKK